MSEDYQKGIEDADSFLRVKLDEAERKIGEIENRDKALFERITKQTALIESMNSKIEKLKKYKKLVKMIRGQR